MHIVVADVGNSSIKLMRATLDPTKRLATPAATSCRTIDPLQVPTRSVIDLPDSSDASPASPWFVSSVNMVHANRLRELAEQQSMVESWNLIRHDQIELQIDVEHPQATGIDRLLAAQAAKHRFAAERDLIVVDCGTAMTIDLVTRDNVFRGGVIIAGPKTSLRALASMTSVLPDLSDRLICRPESVVGRSTEQAMLAGAWLNGLGAIREVVNRISETLENSPVVAGTGGGLGPWREDLPDSWILADNLVLEGLIQIATAQFFGNAFP